MERNISVLYDYVNTEELWRGEEEHEDFQIRWREAQSIQARRVQNEEYVSANKQKAINAWGEEHANAFFGYLSTRSMVELTSKLITTGLSYEHIQLSINNEIVSRLTSPGRGIRNTKGIIQGDLTKALHRRCLQPLVRETLINCGLQVDQDGYYCVISGGNDLLALPNEPQAAIVETATEDKAHTAARDREDASSNKQNVADYLKGGNKEGDDLMSICAVSKVSSEVSSELSELSEAQSIFPSHKMQYRPPNA